MTYSVTQSILKSRITRIFLLFCGMLFLLAGNVEAQLTTEHRRELNTLKRDISRVSVMIRKKEFSEAETAIQTATDKIQEIMSAAGIDQTDRTIAGLERLIEIQQQKLDRASGDGGGMKANGISFSEDVAPIIADNCLGCHDDAARGNLRLDTFAGFRKGGASGPLLSPGNAARSLIAARLATPGPQQMPRGRGPLEQAEIKTVIDWINQGAKFDGGDEARSLPDVIKAAENGVMAEDIKVAKPDGTETVSFKDDIAPMFMTFCYGCHSGNNPASGFSMQNFESILIGGDGGELLVAGSPTKSRLFRLTGGLENPRMPQGQARITRKNYEDLKKWIEEGIKYDAGDPKTPLRDLVPTQAEMQAMALSKKSDAEMETHRKSRAETHWKRTLSSANPITLSDETFILYGNVDQSRLEQAQTWAKAANEQIKTTFGIQQTPKWKGKLAIYVFKDRYDYDEFNRSIENRQPAQTLFGHGKVTDNYDNAYVAVLDTGDTSTASQPSMQWTLSKGIVSAFLQKEADARPAWLTEGASWMLVDPSLRDSQFERSMIVSAGRVLDDLQRPQDLFQQGTFAPDATEHVGFVTAKVLMTSGNTAQFRQFVNRILNGASADQACQAVYNGSLESMAVAIVRAAR